MKSDGIVRELDPLGRVVIPKQWRDALKLDAVEIIKDGQQLILRRSKPSCIFCGNEFGVKKIHDVYVCQRCAEAMPGVFGETERASNE